jgi:integrase
LARLNGDDIREGLKGVRAPQNRIEFLQAHEIRATLEAALAHDAQTFSATLREHAGLAPRGATPRYPPIAPFTLAALLSGMRLGELLTLEWRDVNLSARGENGRVVGEIQLRAEVNKTVRARTVDLSASPALLSLLQALQHRSQPGASVFALTPELAKQSMRRMRKLGAPSHFDWQTCRRTCGTFLTNAPGIFGAASAYRSARQLGHSVAVAESNYLGVVRGIPHEAKTLEAAMGIEDLATRVVAEVKQSRAYLQQLAGDSGPG